MKIFYWFYCTFILFVGLSFISCSGIKPPPDSCDKYVAKIGWQKVEIGYNKEDVIELFAKLEAAALKDAAALKAGTASATLDFGANFNSVIKDNRYYSINIPSDAYVVAWENRNQMCNIQQAFAEGILTNEQAGEEFIKTSALYRKLREQEEKKTP